MITKPMLASAVEDEAALRFPVLVSPKLDGIRCLVVDGSAVSRNFKPIPNEHVRRTIEDWALSGIHLDGELMLRDPQATFQDVSSAIMSRDGEPDFIYHVFDCVVDGAGALAMSYVDRYTQLTAHLAEWGSRWLNLVPQSLAESPADLDAYEADILAEGYEGVMLRSLESPYKCGRSTAREGYLLKLKRFTDAEAVVVGLVEQEQNMNAQQRDELGRAKRSTHKAGKVGKGTLGAFVVCPPEEYEIDGSKTFNIGTGQGLTAQLRQEIWNHPDRYLGKVIKFRYQEHGTKDAPRIPIFLGFRDEGDL